MAKEYVIQGVSEKVKNWSSKYGDFTTYYVQLEGEGDDAIQLNKKSDSPAPKSEDKIYGEITETEFGLKFKSEQRADSKSSAANQTSKPAYKDNSKSITLGLVFKTIAGIRGLPEPGDDDDFAKFYDMVKAHTEELILISEKLDVKVDE